MCECNCEICDRVIKMDTLIDTELWKEISPSGDEGGLLCAACIVDRVADVRSGRKWAAVRLISANI